jgi:hypothetical protein
MPFLLLKLLRFVATGLLLSSLLLPWFCVPFGIHENGHGGYTALVTEAASTPAFKVFLSGVVLWVAWMANRRCRSGPIIWAMPTVAGGYLLFLVLTIVYPALTIQRCAAVSANAAWLQTQNVSLIRVGGDARTAQEYSHLPGEWEVSVKEILPRAFVAIPTPVSSFSELRLARLPQLAMWFGFSPAFYEFARPGWFCGIFGSFLLAISFCRSKKGIGLPCRERWLAHRIFLLFIPGACFLWVLCLVPVVMAGRELDAARENAAEGRFGESLRHLDLAETWIPVLAFNTDAVYQRGWLDHKLGVESRAAELVSAIHEEIEGFSERAIQHYTELLDTEAPKTIRDEAFRGILRLAIKDFNAGLVDRAAFHLTHLLSIDPTSLKANYALQLADLRSFRKDRLVTEVAQFIAIYACMQCLEKRVVISAAHHRLAELDFEYHDPGKVADEMRAALQP